MSRGWKLGDVAVVSIPGRGDVIAMYTDGGYWETPWAEADGETAYKAAPDFSRGFTGRPLVVIDPEDREQVERLLSNYHGWKWEHATKQPSITDMQAALCEFASPTPPRPDEPMGKWAVVTAFGVTYCRAAWASDKPWSRLGTEHFASWDELDVESIEFEGVSDD